MTSRKRDVGRDSDIEEKCPFCFGSLSSGETKCRYCGEQVDKITGDNKLETHVDNIIRV